jgi:hypothetical protein
LCLEAATMFDREAHLHTVIEVARHPIGSPHIDLFRSAVGEIDAAVLQEAADDAPHPYAIADAANSGV